MTATTNYQTFLQRFPIRRSLIFGVLIMVALISFEIFNYSTTDFALADLLGNLRFLGIRWATILAIAFCGIDFAGIARLFTPERGADEPAEVWYLFGAWLIAATMNAMLTWWGVSVAIVNHETLGNAIVARATLIKVVPIFVAIMVWLIRVLIIGTFSVAGENLFGSNDYVRGTTRQNQAYSYRSLANRGNSTSRQTSNITTTNYRPTRPNYQPDTNYARPELTYTPVSSMSSRNHGNNNGGNNQVRR
jgi:hypothetical protein